MHPSSILLYLLKGISFWPLPIHSQWAAGDGKASDLCHVTLGLISSPSAIRQKYKLVLTLATGYSWCRWLWLVLVEPLSSGYMFD